MKIVAIIFAVVVIAGFIAQFIKPRSVKNKINPGTEPEQPKEGPSESY
jgi:hypothetical protein